MELLALTANGLTCTCKQNPIGPAPHPTPTIDCSLQVQRANGTILTQQNHQSPSLQPRKLTNNTSILQVVEPLHCQQGSPGSIDASGDAALTLQVVPIKYCMYTRLSKQWNHKPLSLLQVLQRSHYKQLSSPHISGEAMNYMH